MSPTALAWKGYRKRAYGVGSSLACLHVFDPEDVAVRDQDPAKDRQGPKGWPMGI